MYRAGVFVVCVVSFCVFQRSASSPPALRADWVRFAFRRSYMTGLIESQKLPYVYYSLVTTSSGTFFEKNRNFIKKSEIILKVGALKATSARSKRSPKACWGIPHPLPQRCQSS